MPAGVFVTGTLYIKSNVTIYLSDSAKILGSPSFADYPDNEVHYKNDFHISQSDIDLIYDALCTLL